MKYEWLDSFLLSLPGVEKDFKAEWGWFRYMIRGKLFAAVCSPKGMKDPAYNDHDLVNLKCDPKRAELLRAAYPEILPGFYCDKRPPGRQSPRRSPAGTLHRLPPPGAGKAAKVRPAGNHRGLVSG